MSAAQLKVLLTSGSSSIVFDARPAQLADGSTRAPFFRHGLLKNAIVIKTAEGGSGLRTRLFLPFDSTNTTRGGMSMMCGTEMSHGEMETFFNARLDPAAIESDLRKIEILARTPSFAPFLLRDAFERARVTVDVRHFHVSDVEVRDLKENLKAKLKPLAAMALPTSTAIEGAKLDVLVNKLWDLNDPAFLAPFARALNIMECDTVSTLYAWIGVSYFNREFTKRQTALRSFAEWLVSKPPFGPGAREELVTQFESDRKPVRDRVRSSWSAAGAIFDKFNSSYNKLIQDSDPKLFIEYLQRVQSDFQVLGTHLAGIEQALCIHTAIAKEQKGSQFSLDLLRDLAVSMRLSAEQGLAAA